MSKINDKKTHGANQKILIRLPLSSCDTYALQLISEGHLVVQCCNRPKNIFNLERRKSEKYADLVHNLEFKI